MSDACYVKRRIWKKGCNTNNVIKNVILVFQLIGNRTNKKDKKISSRKTKIKVFGDSSAKIMD